MKQLCDLSGFGWDGAQNIVTADDDVWDRLITICPTSLRICHGLNDFYPQAHPGLKKWRKSAFLLFDDMADLIEGTYATGARVFRPSCDFTPGTGGSAKDTDDKDMIDPLLRQSGKQSLLSVCGLSID